MITEEQLKLFMQDLTLSQHNERKMVVLTGQKGIGVFNDVLKQEVHKRHIYSLMQHIDNLIECSNITSNETTSLRSMINGTPEDCFLAEELIKIKEKNNKKLKV